MALNKLLSSDTIIPKLDRKQSGSPAKLSAKRNLVADTEISYRNFGFIKKPKPDTVKPYIKNTESSVEPQKRGVTSKSMSMLKSKTQPVKVNHDKLKKTSDKTQETLQ